MLKDVLNRKEKIQELDLLIKEKENKILELDEIIEKLTAKKTALEQFDTKCDIKIDFPSLIKNRNNKETERVSLYVKTKTTKFCDNYVVFDLETTGFNAKDSNIIEISALKCKNNEVIDTFDALVNPNEHIPSKVSKLTGITDELVANCDTIDKIMPDFLNFIEDYTLVAHNGSFDFSFVENVLDCLEIPHFKNKNIDTLYMARKYIDNTKNYKLETLKKYFNLEYGSHRGLDDCYTTNYVYQYCKNKKEGN